VLRKIFLIALPASIVALVLMALGVEAWVRMSWDDRRGTPGFLVSHPTRGQRLGFNYDGWSAGVPAKTNALGFRSTRADTVEKVPTRRIRCLATRSRSGTAPFTTIRRCSSRSSRSGAATLTGKCGTRRPWLQHSQELTYLREVHRRADLVIVGFYINDIIGNAPAPSPSFVRTAASNALAFLQEHRISTEFYKRVALTAAWRMSGSESFRRRFDNL
jgi:hypothetical protein